MVSKSVLGGNSGRAEARGLLRAEVRGQDQGVLRDEEQDKERSL